MDGSYGALIFGLGMFFVGWFAHAFMARPPELGEDQDLGEAETPKTRWICPQCHRRRQLPVDLDAKVMLCNNCQVRLVREEALKR